MDNEIKTWLFDILQSINEVESYYADRPKIFEESFLISGLKERLKEI